MATQPEISEANRLYHTGHGHCHDCGACTVTPCAHLLAATTVKQGAEAVRHYEALARAKRLGDARPVPTKAFLDRVKFMTDDDAYDLWRDETR